MNSEERGLGREPLRALDLFCGAGGAAVGLHRAGFAVVGVDHKPQPRYPFEFHQGNAMAFPLEGFDFIWASPPCQRWSMYSRNLGTAANHPDLVDSIRQRLVGAAPTTVIENVVGAPLVSPLTLCGSMFDLDVRRHRLFELVGFQIFPEPQCRHWIWRERKYPGATNRPNRRYTCEVGVRRIPVNVQALAMDTGPIVPVPVYGNGMPQWHRMKWGRNVKLAEQKSAMTIGWMTREELSQATPPAYAEYIGRAAIAAMGCSASTHQSPKIAL